MQESAVGGRGAPKLRITAAPVQTAVIRSFAVAQVSASLSSAPPWPPPDRTRAQKTGPRATMRCAGAGFRFSPSTEGARGGRTKYTGKTSDGCKVSSHDPQPGFERVREGGGLVVGDAVLEAVEQAAQEPVEEVA